MHARHWGHRELRKQLLEVSSYLAPCWFCGWVAHSRQLAPELLGECLARVSHLSIWDTCHHSQTSREFWSQTQVGRLARTAPFPIESSPNPWPSEIILSAARLPFSDTGSVTFASLTHLVFTLYQLLIYSFIFTHSRHLFNNTKWGSNTVCSTFKHSDCTANTHISSRQRLLPPAGTARPGSKQLSGSWGRLLEPRQLLDLCKQGSWFF